MTMDSEVGDGSAVTAMEGTSKEGKTAGLDLRDALLLMDGEESSHLVRWRCNEVLWIQSYAHTCPVFRRQPTIPRVPWSGQREIDDS